MLGFYLIVKTPAVPGLVGFSSCPKACHSVSCIYTGVYVSALQIRLPKSSGLKIPPFSFPLTVCVKCVCGRVVAAEKKVTRSYTLRASMFLFYSLSVVNIFYAALFTCLN